MRKLDVKEIHGYHAAAGLKLLKPEALAARQKAAGSTREPAAWACRRALMCRSAKRFAMFAAAPLRRPVPANKRFFARESERY